uniref:Uncharacterized protein n=1 Tax=Vitis vinifera TaxID=29760 RepID=A5AHL1_VITVI|nr:hypothetical protein VITISV_013700 [Vitis vinifera]
MDVSLESKSLPSVGNSRKSYLQVTSQRLARGKLVHLHGQRSLALPSVGPGEFWDLDNKNLKKNISMSRSQISGSTKDHFSGENEVWEISQTHKKGCEITSQQKADFAALRSWLSACGVRLPTAQSEIEESSLESMAKDIRTECPDTPSEGGGTWAVAGCRNDRIRMELLRIAMRAPCHSGRGVPTPCTRRRPPCDLWHRTFYPDVRHPEFCSVNILPRCLTSGILLRRHSIRIFRIRRLMPDGRRGRFNFPGQTYPDPLIALTRRVSQPFCTVPRCSPEASRYVRPTF